MKPKNILFLASWYPSKNNPTLGNFVQRHAEAASIYSNVTALFITSSDLVEEITIEKEEVNGVETVIAYYPKITTKLPLVKSLDKYKMYMQVSEQAFKSIDKAFDLVHLNIAYPAGLFALWLKERMKINYVLSEHWTGYLPIKNDFSKLNYLQKWQHRKIFKNASAIFPVSSHLGDALKKLGLIESYQVLPNVVNDELFYPAEEPPKRFRFIHISTFDDAHKNVSGMFRVFKKLQDDALDFDVHIVTEGPKEDVINLSETFGLEKERLIVDHALDQKEVAQALRSASCLVLFSNYETFSVVLAEAWMSGIPCIYSQCGGLTEIDNPDIGIQIITKDEDALYQSTKNLVVGKQSFKKDKIVTFSSRFIKKNVARDIDDYYKDLSQ